MLADVGVPNETGDRPATSCGIGWCKSDNHIGMRSTRCTPLRRVQNPIAGPTANSMPSIR